MLEKGWLAGGNMARNTTIIRSNYLWDESAGIYEHALKLWEGLAEELDYPILFSQRGVLNLAHSLQDVRDSVRRVEANRLNGVDAEWLDAEQVKEVCPIVNISPDVRYPVLGATYQPRAGIAKHDHVAWGLARAADAAGIDIIQNCEVTGLDIVGGRVVGVQTTRGPIAAGKVALCAAGHTSVLAAMAGIELPLQSHPLQALVSELLEPVHPTVVMSNAVHVYVSQAHKGELVMGAGIDAYNSYTQRGAFHIIEAADVGGPGALPGLRPRPCAAHLGRHRRRQPRTPRRSSASPRSTTSTSTAAGAPAASRPPRASAGSTPTPSPTTPRTRSTPPSRSTVSPPARSSTSTARPRWPTEGAEPMLLIPCPWCGPRDEAEFHYGGQAHVAYPENPAALTDEEWARYLFFRDNPKGPFAERWSHAAGCRRWFNAVRDTATNEILAVYRAGEQTGPRRPGRRRLEPSGTNPSGVRTRPSGRPGAGAEPPHVASQPFRLTAGPSRPGRLRFTFDGTDYQGFRGDTLASALLANGVIAGRHQHQARPPARHLLRRRRGAQRRRPDRGTLPRADAARHDRRALRRPGRHAACPARAASPPNPTPPATTPYTPTATCWSSARDRPGSPPRPPPPRSGARVILADDQPEPGGSLLGTGELLDWAAEIARAARRRPRGARPAPHHRLRLLRRQPPPRRRTPHQPPRRRGPRRTSPASASGASAPAASSSPPAPTSARWPSPTTTAPASCWPPRPAPTSTATASCPAAAPSSSPPTTAPTPPRWTCTAAGVDIAAIVDTRPEPGEWARACAERPASRC